ncbi:hypothetical protein Bbelb_406440 [Branchiostoma belcheri]|nr:hypothetical protein Bbelb_406440 [Branchiostoma belcheri]
MAKLAVTCQSVRRRRELTSKTGADMEGYKKCCEPSHVTVLANQNAMTRPSLCATAVLMSKQAYTSDNRSDAETSLPDPIFNPTLAHVYLSTLAVCADVPLSGKGPTGAGQSVAIHVTHGNMIGSPVATSTPTGQAPKPPPRVKSQQKPLRAVVINFQSIRNKVSEFHVFCDTVKPDVIVGTESWLDPTVGNSEIFPTSYSAYRKDREGRGGGVFIAVKNSIIATHLPDPDCTSELTWVQIQLAHSKTVHIGAYYRPPSADQSDLTSLEQSLTRIRDQSKSSHIWLAGDFNLPTARWNTDTTSNSTSNLSNGQDSTDTAALRHQGVLTADPKEKAEALGEQFESVFTKEDTNIIPTLGEPSVPTTPELKHGFRKGLSCETQLLVTTHDLAHGLDQNLQIDAVVLDFSKAFDTVPHQRLLSKLQYYGIKGHILSWLKAFLTERTQTVVLDGESSKPSRVTSGVPQGTSPTDAQGLQADLDALTEWQDLHISNDMRWDAHIAHATGKANRTLGVIRRNLCHCTSQVKNTCYKALVRPQLEYCASVWDPYTAGGVQAVERVQRRAARMVMNDYARTSSAVQAQSVEAFRASLL